MHCEFIKNTVFVKKNFFFAICKHTIICMSKNLQKLGSNQNVFLHDLLI